MKRSNSKDEKKQKVHNKLIEKEYKNYIKYSEKIIGKVKETIKSFSKTLEKNYIEQYLTIALKLINQIERRVLAGEVIPHNEKIFSIFEPHTEWISKGKAGVPQELGVRVCVVQDQFGFMLHHNVMEKKTDNAVAVGITEEVKKMFPEINQASFDKGFYSPENKTILETIVEKVVMTRKGKLNQEEKKKENEEEYRKAKRAHRAVESGISAMENHGLDRCPDRGIIGFKRYVGMAFVARNIQMVGEVLFRKNIKRLRRLKNRKKQNAA